MHRQTADHIARVMKAVRRCPGTPVARGELTLDPAFARKYLKWRSRDSRTESLSDTALLIECCKCLELDLICLQSENVAESGACSLVALDDIRHIAGAGLFVFWVVNGAFQTAMTQGDMMAFLMKTAAAPNAIAAALERISGKVTDVMAKGVAAGAHGIILADDIAYRQSTYVSPSFVERHLLPLWRRQVAFAKDLGVPVFFHSDGNLKAILPFIAAAGFDGLQCVESSAGMDLGDIKKGYGGHLCLMGSIDPGLLCEAEGVDDSDSRYACLRRSVADAMAAAGDGGVILGTCSGLHAGMSPRLVDTLYRLAAEMDPMCRKRFAAAGPASRTEIEK